MTQPTDRPARILDRYRLLEEIGSGGMACVLRARDEQLQRDVAVKLLHPHLLPDIRSRDRLAAEARAAASLSHPGVAAVYDIEIGPGAPALVMELVDGEPLSSIVARSGPMPPQEVARIGAEVADALYHAHRRGIVHRDVKPGNILLERDTGRVRLVDFGIAHSLAAGSGALTQAGTALGTPRYMPPEQLAGEKVGPRADLWSLGAVMYEALTGRPAYEGSSPLAIARQQQAGQPATDGVEPGIATIVLACLETHPDQRPVHAAALAGALRDYGSSDRSPTTMLVPIGGALTAGPTSRLARAGRRVPSRLPLLVAGAGTVVLLALLALNVAPPGGTLADAERSPTPSTAPSPTPDPLGPLRPLLASYREACGGEPNLEELSELPAAEAEERLVELVRECREERSERDDDEDDEDDERGGGRDGEGEGNNGNGNGNGDNGNRGNGGGNGNGNGNGRGRSG